MFLHQGANRAKRFEKIREKKLARQRWRDGGRLRFRREIVVELEKQSFARWRRISFFRVCAFCGMPRACARVGGLGNVRFRAAFVRFRKNQLVVAKAKTERRRVADNRQ